MARVALVSATSLVKTATTQTPRRCAVIKTGGLLGSHHHYPVQWSALRYEPARQAFETGLTLDELQAGPCEFDDDTFDWGDRSRSYPHANYWTV